MRRKAVLKMIPSQFNKQINSNIFKGVVYTHYFTLGWDFTSGWNIFCLHASFTPGWNLNIFTPLWNEIVFSVYFTTKSSFHLRLKLIFCLHVKKQLISPGVEISPLSLRPGWSFTTLVTCNNMRDSLRDWSEVTSGWISTQGEIMHVNYPKVAPSQ